MILTAALSTGVVRVADGAEECARLVEEILGTEHLDWETVLNVGDIAFYQSRDDGPFPNHQLRMSVRPGLGYAALNYMDHDDESMPVANSWNPGTPPPAVDLIFNGSTGAVFPRTAAIPVADARLALLEWLRTRQRPTCVEWRAYDDF